jgi:hypothetical protein
MYSSYSKAINDKYILIKDRTICWNFNSDSLFRIVDSVEPLESEEEGVRSLPSVALRLQRDVERRDARPQGVDHYSTTIEQICTIMQNMHQVCKTPYIKLKRWNISIKTF